MYHSPVIQRSPKEDEEHMRRDDRANSNSQQLPPYKARSPSAPQFPHYSPSNGTQAAYNGYSSRPSSSTALPMTSSITRSPRLGRPHSPNGLSHLNRGGYPHAPREAGSSTYYDPTSDHREGSSSWNQPAYQVPSPIQVCDGHD